MGRGGRYLAACYVRLHGDLVTARWEVGCGDHESRLREAEGRFAFAYDTGFDGPPVSLTLPVRAEAYRFDRFPPFFDGLLPEGWQLETLLQPSKLDRHDYMGRLLAVGSDTVGAVTVLPETGQANG